MAREGSRRAGCSRQAGARGGGRRRPPTWEVSDSDGEGPAGAEARARARGPAEERRAATEERRAAAEALRPEQALRRVAVRVDPGAGSAGGDGGTSEPPPPELGRFPSRAAAWSAGGRAQAGGRLSAARPC